MVIILVLSSIVGLGTNTSLIKKYFQGEFKQGFYSSEKYPHITYITLAEAEQLFASQDAVFVDSRPSDLFQKGHILGALNIPFGEKKEKEILGQLDLPSEKSLVVYCDGSECRSSVELAKALHEYGLKSIKVFFGGWKEWIQAGLPVSAENDPQ